MGAGRGWLRAQGMSRHRLCAVPGEHAPHRVAVYPELPGDGAHAPAFNLVQAQDLRAHLRGYGHGGLQVGAHGAASSGAPRTTARPGSVGTSSRVVAGVGRSAPRSAPDSATQGSCSMSAVEHRPPPAGNPGASRSGFAVAGASAANAQHGRAAHPGCAGTGRPPRVVPLAATGPSTPASSSAGPGRSGCTAAPAPCSVRTGTVGPMPPREGPSPAPSPGLAEGAGRRRPAAPHWRGTTC